MAGKEVKDKLSIYIPQSKMQQRPVERLIALGKSEIDRPTISLLRRSSRIWAGKSGNRQSVSSHTWRSRFLTN